VDLLHGHWPSFISESDIYIVNSQSQFAETTHQCETAVNPVEHTVLLIDDDQSVLHGLARALRNQPYRILTATSGEEAMLAVKSHAIDVVVADEHMPGMRGGELLVWIAEHCPEVMRIVLTGHPTVENMIQAINEGRVYQFFTKPCNPAHLGVAIRKALEHKQLVEDNHRLAAGNGRQAKELNDRRTSLRIMSKIIADDIRLPLQAVLRLGGSLENMDTAIDYKTRDLVGTALKNLMTVENVANDLAERSTHEQS
jgi:response regulator RpfG family c-di-GMP phosphodiesterase